LIRGCVVLLAGSQNDTTTDQAIKSTERKLHHRMAVDAKGNLYTTHAGNVHIYNADGKELEQIDVPEGPANVCFGGEDFKTLFITARTSLYSIRVIHPGAKPPTTVTE